MGNGCSALSVGFHTLPQTTPFLTRRLRNVKTEITLNVLACNIRRMVALIGIQGLIAAMKA